jgi:hypothetical protein
MLALIHSAGGWDTHDASGQRIGTYPEEKAIWR